ncbi:related to Pre-mRNA-processing factor 17 [Saccharomycodes ludwigii]|uniref:Pre-mRNA-processing factor 17 n=1 Tax=Saccharomycodes ludwigii TaxID=36035 RepID=A0A376B9K6_9ASCO|nr:related to Pre-mRNA-processing factor 17 [Saccharomycodes ludwigii]
MGALLAPGYSSSDSDSDDTQNNIVINEDKKKRTGCFTKAELKALKKKRKGNDPWSEWETSNVSAELQENTNKQSSNEINDTSKNSKSLFNVIDSNNEFFVQENETSNTYYKYKKNIIQHLNENSAIPNRCYMPKKIIHKYEGHEGGTNTVKYMPNTGNFFISGGNDKIIKLWDCKNKGKLVKDYRGHSMPIKSLEFDNGGEKFISISFENILKIWDTETGKVDKRIKLPALPTCCKINPQNNNEFIVGLSNSTILHYDKRQDGLIQNYDSHLSSILDLAYFPQGDKFISSSEDKTIKIWNNGINIPIKQISDTTQYAMPCVKVHPKKKYFVTQSMDNIIYTYQLKPKYQKQKKTFKGHRCAGFNIEFSISPDGQYLISGDSRGSVFIWDWNSTKILKNIRTNVRKPITTVDWSPRETSKVIFAGNEGPIYLLD